eukprot:2371-Heterococcus_DN1.PRE.1
MQVPVCRSAAHRLGILRQITPNYSNTATATTFTKTAAATTAASTTATNTAATATTNKQLLKTPVTTDVTRRFCTAAALFALACDELFEKHCSKGMQLDATCTAKYYLVLRVKHCVQQQLSERQITYCCNSVTLQVCRYWLRALLINPLTVAAQRLLPQYEQFISSCSATADTGSVSDRCSTSTSNAGILRYFRSRCGLFNNASTKRCSLVLCLGSIHQLCHHMVPPVSPLVPVSYIIYIKSYSIALKRISDGVQSERATCNCA